MENVSQVLADVRQQLGVPPDEVERHLRLDPGTLRRVEEGRAQLDTSLLDQLARLYGVPAADLAAGLDVKPALESVRVLLKASVPDLSAAARSDVARVAAARRQFRDLEDELGLPNRYDTLRSLFKHEGVYGAPGAEWREGRDFALRLRDHFGLDERARLPSMRDLVDALGIELVSSHLCDQRVAAFSLSDRTHGPAIVVNSRGANANPWVRRFTLAHELCHVLHDEREHREIAPIQLYDESFAGGRGAEPRANAFAAHLLAPDMAVLDLYLQLKPKRALAAIVRSIMEYFGVNFKMARYRLAHACQIPMAELDALRGVAVSPSRQDDVFRNEALWDEEFFPCPSIPPERRGKMVRAVVTAWTSRLLDRGQAVALLEAAPDEPLETLRDLG